MRKPVADADSGLTGDPPAGVRVTVVSGPRGPTLSDRTAALASASGARTIASVVAVVIVIAAVGGIALWRAPSGFDRSERGPSNNAARMAGTPAHASAGAPADPAGCMIVGIALHDPRFGRPNFDRQFPCLRLFDALTSRHGGRVLARPPDLATRRHT
jgi:hypothetical protein